MGNECTEPGSCPFLLAEAGVCVCVCWLICNYSGWWCLWFWCWCSNVHSMGRCQEKDDHSKCCLHDHSKPISYREHLLIRRTFSSRKATKMWIRLMVEKGIIPRLWKDWAPSAEAEWITSFTQITPPGSVIYKTQNRGDLFKNIWKLFMDYVDGSGINVWKYVILLHLLERLLHNEGFIYKLCTPSSSHVFRG